VRLDLEKIARTLDRGAEIGRDNFWDPFDTPDRFRPRRQRERIDLVRHVLLEAAKQFAYAGWAGTAHNIREWVGPDASALDAARRTLAEAERAQAEAADKVRAARAQVDAIERG
jgi:hypothetical protein